ncbi:MAG: ATP-dependent zinc protease [Planctomycetota bacterium]|nr:MAG: ATP-dependent zinc protease [Planctomycetota bacterium]
MSKERIIVGWNELVDLPDWGVEQLPAKIDSGARSSSLHVEDLVLSGDTVRFRLAHGQGQTISVPVLRRARVISSNGRGDMRVFVHTRLQLGPLLRRIECNLVDRGDMRFPMLIGRSALRGRYLVNCGRRHLVSPPHLDR